MSEQNWRMYRFPKPTGVILLASSNLALCTKYTTAGLPSNIGACLTVSEVRVIVYFILEKPTNGELDLPAKQCVR